MGGSAKDTLVIYTGVFEETVILGGKKGLDHLLGDFVVVQRLATFFAVFCDEQVIAAVDSQGNLELNILECFDGWQFGFDVKINPVEASGADKAQAK